MSGRICSPSLARAAATWRSATRRPAAGRSRTAAAWRRNTRSKSCGRRTAMVILLIVSHSAKLADGVKELADQMAGGAVKIAGAGGTADGSLGTSTELIHAGLEAVASQDGTLILVDLG